MVADVPMHQSKALLDNAHALQHNRCRSHTLQRLWSVMSCRLAQCQVFYCPCPGVANAAPWRGTRSSALVRLRVLARLSAASAFLAMGAAVCHTPFGTAAGETGFRV